MKRVIFILLIAQLSIPHFGQIIADHTVIGKFDDIPQEYIDEVKKMLVIVAGESHTNGYFEGLLALGKLHPSHKVEWSSGGSPQRYTDKYLRVGRNTWGDYGSETGWINWYGEEDWFTNETALARTKAGISYCHANNLTIRHGFEWCSDTLGPITIGMDPFMELIGQGEDEEGPEGTKAWELMIQIDITIQFVWTLT